jgi:hypothetical protein
MLCCIKGNPRKILEPSAGKGDIIDALMSRYNHYGKPEVSAIEIDPTLQATLWGKGIKVIDSDFLAYAGPDKFCAIVMNPPFDNGDKHLLKAIEILYRGQIVCLLNAETLRNPHTNSRKLLTRKLEELNATIEYIPGAFLTAERKTAVEVALISIIVERKVEDDLFRGADDTAEEVAVEVEEKHEVATGKTVEELVLDYNQRVQVGTDTIIGFYRNFRKVGNYLSLNEAGGKDKSYNTEDLTTMMQNTLNTLLVNIRKDFWRKALDLKEVKSRLTEKKRQEFETVLTQRAQMDFTEKNIRQFVINLIGSYEQVLTDAVLDLFDKLTLESCYRSTPYEKNIHYFNGWKTNNAFKVGKRVVVNMGGESTFQGYRGWELGYQVAGKIRDMDLVFSYFGGHEDHVSLFDAMTAAFTMGENSGESTYFKFTAHKKGTLHITFLNLDILRRFNVCACRGKGWLPEDYGAKPYAQLGYAEKQSADSFDGEKSYKANTGRSLFVTSKLMIAVSQ